MRSISEALQSFKLADLQTFRTILSTLDREGYAVDQALRYIYYVTRTLETPLIDVCPECGGKLQLYKVNHTNCTKVGGSFRSQWWCGDCGYEILSRKSFHFVAHKFRMLKHSHVYKDIEHEKEAIEWELDIAARKPISIDCPKCDGHINLHKITTPPGKANVYGYKSVWFCDFCGYEEYNKNSIREEVIRLRRI